MNKYLTALAIAVAVAAASTAVTSSADAQRYGGYRHYNGFDGAYAYVYYPRGYSSRTRGRFGTFTRSRQGQRSG